MYKILYCKKLDWLKRKNAYGDKMDFYLFFPPIIFFILVINFAPKWAIMLFIMYIPFGIIGAIRHIKSVPGDIESKLMGNGLCLQILFMFVVVLISLIVFLGKLF